MKIYYRIANKDYRCQTCYKDEKEVLESEIDQLEWELESYLTAKKIKK